MPGEDQVLVVVAGAGAGVERGVVVDHGRGGRHSSGGGDQKVLNMITS